MDVIIKYFIDNGVTSIDQTPYTWNQLGEMYGITGNAARKRWKKYNRATIMTKAVTAPVNGFEPKILVFDLETAPLQAYVWRLWKQNVNPLNGQLQSEWFLLTYSAKWLFDNSIISGKLSKACCPNAEISTGTVLVSNTFKSFIPQNSVKTSIFFKSLVKIIATA